MCASIRAGFESGLNSEPASTGTIQLWCGRATASRPPVAVDPWRAENGCRHPYNGRRQPRRGRRCPKNGCRRPQGGCRPPRNGRSHPENGYRHASGGCSSPRHGRSRLENSRRHPSGGGRRLQNGPGQPWSACAHPPAGRTPAGRPDRRPALPAGRSDQKSNRACSCARSASASSTSKRLYSPRRATRSVKRYCAPTP